MWEIFSVIPSIGFLLFFYWFMIDITSYFATNNTTAYNSSYYLRLTQNYLLTWYNLWVNSYITLELLMA